MKHSGKVQMLGALLAVLLASCGTETSNDPEPGSDDQLDDGKADGLDDPGRSLTPGEAADCIAQARRCAFEQLPRFNGALGRVRAIELMDECLEEASLPDGRACRGACSAEFDEAWIQPGELCSTIREALIFYADQTEACVQVFEDCMDTCYDDGQIRDGDEFHNTREAICMVTGDNDPCDDFARDHTECAD